MLQFHMLIQVLLQTKGAVTEVALMFFQLSVAPVALVSFVQSRFGTIETFALFFNFWRGTFDTFVPFFNFWLGTFDTFVPLTFGVIQ